FGSLISAYFFAAAAIGIITAVFVDRFDRKRLLLGIYVGFVASALVTASAQSYPMLLAARALAGIFGGVLGGMIFAVVGDAVPDVRRGHATGVVMTALSITSVCGVVMTPFSIATVAGVPAALFLTNLFSWRAAFVLVAILGAINAVAARRVLPEV